MASESEGGIDLGGDAEGERMGRGSLDGVAEAVAMAGEIEGLGPSFEMREDVAADDAAAGRAAVDGI